MSANPSESATPSPPTPILLQGLASLNALVGKEILSPDWLPITQDRINTFAEVTHDQQWIHTDPVRAQKESPFHTTIAHGFLTLSLLSHLFNQAVSIPSGPLLAVNYGFNKVRFPAPVRAADEVRARFLLRSLEPIPNGLHANFLATVEIRNSVKPACAAEWLMRFYTTL